MKRNLHCKMEPMMKRRLGVHLPCDKPNWSKLASTIEELKHIHPTEIKKLEITLKQVQAIVEEELKHPRYTSSGTAEFYFGGLINFLEHDASPEEKESFFTRILPTISSLALEIENLRPPGPLMYSLQQQDSCISLSRRLAASLVSHSFLCTLPVQDSVDLNQINFTYFFKHLENLNLQKAQASKLRCVLHYFERLSEIWSKDQPSGQILFHRKVFPQSLMPSLDTWETSKVPLCAFIVKQDGAIEDAGSNVVQVDFANRYIGGGVLTSGLVQEEIRFISCPELIAGLCLVECLQDNEALEISGFEQYSSHSGYSYSFSFDGDFQDGAEADSAGNLETSLLAIDASPFYDTSNDQYRDGYLQRDLNKAFIGFLPSRETDLESVDDEQSDEDISFYSVTTEKSYLTTTDTDFETASESLDVPTKMEAGDSKGSSLNLSHITSYGNALSKAITNIAVKDASILQGGDSFDYSLGADGTDVEDSLECSIDGDGDAVRSKEWLPELKTSPLSKDLLNFCEQLTQEVIISVISHKSPWQHSHAEDGDESRKHLVSGMSSETAVDNKNSEMSNFSSAQDKSADIAQLKGNTDKLKSDSNLTGMVDDLVASAVTEALNRTVGQPSPSDNGSVHSGVSSSIGDFSVISSTSAHSETFVKVNLEETICGSASLDNKQLNLVENFVSDVIGQAVCIVKKLDDSKDGAKGCAEGGETAYGMQRMQDDSACFVSASGELRDGRRPFDAHQTLSQNADHLVNGEVGSRDDFSPPPSPPSAHRRCRSHRVPRVPPLQGPVVNIEGGDSPLPGTPPPSPSFQQPDQSSRSSFSEADLLIFGEELLHLQEQKPQSHQLLGTVETYVEEYDDDEESELDHMIAAASRRSSSRSGSASSKPSNLDSFTEGLLKIGDIDPQGRRPSRTEESLQYFSAELAKRVEKDRYNLRRESDLDRFAFDLFHGLDTEPQEERVINEDVAVVCASRLAADIMQDVAIQMFGTVFPHSVRLIPADEGFFPPRREPSETDLLSLAANLANTILESALRTYRRDILGNTSVSDSSESVPAELESELNSQYAQIDENSVCDSTVDDVQRSRVETYHFSSLDEMAWSISSTVLSEVFVDIRKVKLLEELHERSLCDNSRPLATGNWGCGVFGGDPQLKSLLQWVAASQAGLRIICYYSFGDRRVEELPEVVQLLRMRGWTVGKTIRFLRAYCKRKMTYNSVGDLFQEILKKRLTA